MHFFACNSSSGTTYQLINGTLYRDKSCLFPNRCEGVEHFLTKLTNLSNFEIVVNLRDYPQVSKFSNANVPVFSFSKVALLSFLLRRNFNPLDYITE